MYSFNVGGARLEIRNPYFHSSLPPEASWCLFLNEGGRLYTLRNLGQLNGHIRVRDAKDALEFARLLSSPLTYRYLEGGYHGEIVVREWLPSRLAYGNAEASTWEIGRRDGQFGAISLKTYRQIGAKVAKVVPEKGGYRIERYVLVPSETTFRLRPIWLTEHVASNGGYASRGTAVTDCRIARFPWTYVTKE